MQWALMRRNSVFDSPECISPHENTGGCLCYPEYPGWSFDLYRPTSESLCPGKESNCEMGIQKTWDPAGNHYLEDTAARRYDLSYLHPIHGGSLPAQYYPAGSQWLLYMGGDT